MSTKGSEAVFTETRSLSSGAGAKNSNKRTGEYSGSILSGDLISDFGYERIHPTMTSSFCSDQVSVGKGQMQYGTKYKSARGFYISDKDVQKLAEKTSAEFRSIGSGGKNEFKALNTSLASYIEKVRLLEQQNLILVTRYRQISVKYNSKLDDLYFVRVRRLKKTLDTLKTDCILIESEVEHMRTGVEDLKKQLGNTVQNRKKLELELANPKENVDECTLVRIDLEKKLVSLKEELDFENSAHNEVVNELKCRLGTDHVRVQMDNRELDLLRDVRAQYDIAAKRDKEETETRCRRKLNELNMLVSQNANRLKDAQIERSECRQQVSIYRRQITFQYSNKYYLERQLAALEDRFKTDSDTDSN